MTRAQLPNFIATHKLGVVSSIGEGGAPQSALVGIAVTPELKIVFDTLGQSRKAQNLYVNAACSIVIGWSGDITVQFEGLARGHKAEEEGPWKDAYFAAWPECRDHLKWPGIACFVVSPKWIRYSDFNQSPPEILEFKFPEPP
jgi:hypothetical protein